VSHFCDRVVVMYAGRVVEEVQAGALAQATHGYTRGLLECLPTLSHPKSRLPVMTRDPAWLA
jgi:peptide/nickel transport system ATP-binding protein